MSSITPFEKGHQKVGGRKKGSRNKLSADFIEALTAEFEKQGAEAIRIVAIEKPAEFLKIVAAIVPKEFEITDNRLKEIPDDELDALIEYARRRLSIAGKPNAGDAGKTSGGEEPTLN